MLGTTAQPGVQQSSTVKAERSHYFDAGIQQVVLPGLTLGVDGFYKRARNLIDEGQFGSPILLTAFNYGRGDVTGVEFSGTYEDRPAVAVRQPDHLARDRARHRQQPVQLQPGRPRLHRPALHPPRPRPALHRLGGRRLYAHAGAARRRCGCRADLLVGSGLRSGNVDIPNGRALGGYYTINLSAVQKLDPSVLGGRGRGTELRLDVINLLDRKYVLRDGSGLGVGNPQYGLRRAILAGVSQQF